MYDKKILIVDDMEDLRDPLAQWLRKKGFKNVLTAMKATEALEKIEKEKPDLILLDITLEDVIDGVEVLKRTKEGLSPASKVCMVSGHRDTYEDICKKLGAEEFVGKPVFPNKLLEIIVRLLSS